MSGFDIIPRTLAVADYVLSSEICIGERREEERRGEKRGRWVGRGGDREGEEEGPRGRIKVSLTVAPHLGLPHLRLDISPLRSHFQPSSCFID